MQDSSMLLLIGLVSGFFLGLLKFLIIPLLAFCLLHCLVNMRQLQRLRPIPCPAPENDFTPQNISVLVPARNEELRIRDCLSSLMAQEPPVREIILLDDRSADRTAEIARELGFSESDIASSFPRLRFLSGKELPPGWVGKNWACHQLSQAADLESDHLLFTDADTTHHPASLRTALDYARQERTDLLSLWPDQITGTWSEKLIIPLGYLLFMAFQPFLLLRWLQADPSRVSRWGFSSARLASFGAANGQFLLFSRDAYRKLGGHESLRDHLVEDIAFGRRVAARTGEGMRLVNAEGRDLVRCRMYANFAELWEGFSKNLRPVFEESFAGFLLFGIMISGVFLAPFIFLVLSPLLPAFVLPSLIAVALIALMRLILTLRFGTSWLGALGHPFAVILALLIALNSWRLCRSQQISWKGRTYSGVTKSSG